MKVHSQLQKLANKLKTVKPLTKVAFPTYTWSSYGPSGSQPHEQGGKYGQEKVTGVISPTSTSIPEYTGDPFIIINDERQTVDPFIRNIPDNQTNGGYRVIVLKNGVALIVSNQPDENGNYKVFTYNDMGQYMPDVNSDEMKVLSRLGTAVYSDISSSNAPVEDLLTGQSISLAQVPQDHIPVIIPNSHTGGLLSRGTKGINNDILYAALEEVGPVSLVADQIYNNGGIRVDKDYYSGDGWFWGEDAPVGTFNSDIYANNTHGTNPISSLTAVLFSAAQANVNELTPAEQAYVDGLPTQEQKNKATQDFQQEHIQYRDAAINQLREIGYDPKLGYIPGLTENLGGIPISAYDMVSYKPDEDGFSPNPHTRGSSTVFNTPNMIGLFASSDNFGDIKFSPARNGITMQYTDPHVQGVNSALSNEEAAQQAFAQIQATYPDYENIRYDPGNLQGDAKTLYDLIFYNRLLIDVNARDISKEDPNFMTQDGNYPEQFDWRRIPVLSDYEGFKAANLSEVNENTNELQDPFTRFAIASQAHKRFRRDLDQNGHYQSLAYRSSTAPNIVSRYALVSDGRPGVVYDTATHRANHYNHELRKRYVSYARQAELMRQAMEYAVPLDNNLTFRVYAEDKDDDKANSHLAIRGAQLVYPNQDIQTFRMSRSDDFMGHPRLRKSYDRLYRGPLGLPARALKGVADTMSSSAQWLNENDTPVIGQIAAVPGTILEYGSVVPQILSHAADVPFYGMVVGDLATGGISRHWDRGNDQWSVPTMQHMLGVDSNELDGFNSRAVTLAYDTARTGAGRSLDNLDAEGYAEYINSGLGVLTLASLGLRGAANGIGAINRLARRPQMSNLVSQAIQSGNYAPLVYNAGKGTILYGDDAFRAAKQAGRENFLTLSDDAFMSVVNQAQKPVYTQGLLGDRWRYLTKPADFLIGFSGAPRMNLTMQGMRNWRDIYQHMYATGQSIPWRISSLFNTVDPFMDALRFQSFPYRDENNNLITITQPSGFDPTFGLAIDRTGLNNAEEIVNHISADKASTEGLYSTIGQGYAPNGSLVYKPWGNINGNMFTNNSVVADSPWYPLTSSYIHGRNEDLLNLPMSVQYNTSDYNYVQPSYVPDQDIDTQVYDYGWSSYTDYVPVQGYSVPNYVPDQTPVYDYGYGSSVHDYGSTIYDSGPLYDYYTPAQISNPDYKPVQLPTYDNNSPLGGYDSSTSYQNGKLELNQDGTVQLIYPDSSETTTGSEATSPGTSSGQPNQYKTDADGGDDSFYDNY